MRFITFETLVTGVRAFECAFSVRTSSFVHGLMTRRAVFAFTVLADFVPLTVLFKALGIIQVLHLNAAQIGMRCGDKKAGSLTYSILSDNWYVRHCQSILCCQPAHEGGLELRHCPSARNVMIASDTTRPSGSVTARRDSRLGHMGHSFAVNLVADGYQVLVYDRDPKRRRR